MPIAKFEDRLKARIAASAKLADFVQWTQSYPSPRWVFRGQSQRWPLLSTIGRMKPYQPELEAQILNVFRRAAVQFVPREAIQNPWDLLALAQHHGLPTRLIDWTTNALVAAYFASQRSPNGKRDGEIIAVEATRIGFLDVELAGSHPLDIQKAGFVFTSAVATRIVAQKGLFGVHPEPTRPWRLRNQTRRFIIPAEMKSDFQRALFSMGMDAAFVMADLDGLSKTLKWRYENGVLGA
jgi:hypothetical protein